MQRVCANGCVCMWVGVANRDLLCADQPSMGSSEKIMNQVHTHMYGVAHSWPVARLTCSFYVRIPPQVVLHWGVASAMDFFAHDASVPLQRQRNGVHTHERACAHSTGV